MINVSGTTKPTRAAGVLAQQVKPDDATLVLLNPRSGEYYTLEAVGTRVWQLADGSRTIGQMAGILGQEYDAASDVIEGDIVELVKELIDEELLAPAP